MNDHDDKDEINKKIKIMNTKAATMRHTLRARRRRNGRKNK
jgi:hypothetical protein